MKSIFLEEEQSNVPTYKYPILMLALKNGDSVGNFVVLFVNEEDGTIVYDPDRHFTMGFMQKGWIKCTDTAEWRPLTKGEAITLTN